MTKTFLVALILLFSGVVVAQMPIAELPRTYKGSRQDQPVVKPRESATGPAGFRRLVR